MLKGTILCMGDSVYHATFSSHGDEMVFDRGGYYEKVRDDGTPVQQIASGTFFGFATSDVEELAASKKPECAIFAVLKNMANERTTGEDVTVNVYEMGREPDVDMSKSIAGDFSLNEEVRFRDLDTKPVTGTLAHSVTFPSRVLKDVQLTYLPCQAGHNGTIDVWGKQVQQAIRHCIETGQYPVDVTSIDDVDRPDVEAYEKEFRR